jgi:hypothetical protein
VADTFWTSEVEIRADGFKPDRLGPGTLWGFNVVRARIGNDAEYGELVPSYGFPGIPDRYGYLLFE